ncbi:MAG: YitT family protein [Cytophagales bacterium]
MTRFMTKIIGLVLKKNNTQSKYTYAKKYRYLKINTKRFFKDVFLISLGVVSAAFGFKGFLLTNHFIDGGVTGISLLLKNFVQIPFYYLLFIINIPFVILGYNMMGRYFALKTILAIGLLSAVLALAHFPDITKDNVLVAVFGGFFLGAGIGLAIRGGAVIDGTEILAIYISKKFGASIGDIIIGINLVIFSVAAYSLGIEIALYSLITYISASKTLDFLVEGIEEYIGVTIVTAHFKEVRAMIISKLGRGVTIYEGKRGYGKYEDTRSVEVVYTVITRLELHKLKNELEKIAPNAFVVINSVKEAKGGLIKKRPLQH